MRQAVNAQIQPFKEVSWKRAETNVTQKPDLIFKVVITGKALCGKTSLLRALCGRDQPLESEDEGSALIFCNNLLVELRFTAGDLESLSLSEDPMTAPNEEYYRADLKIVLVDISNRASFTSIEKFVQELRGLFIIVGTKADDDAIRQLDVIPCKAVPRYLEVSAKTGKNVDQLISKLLSYLSHKLINEEMHQAMLIEKLFDELQSNESAKNKFQQDISTQNYFYRFDPDQPLKEDVNWRFMKKNELRHLSRDYCFRIAFSGPEKETKALIKSIQIHGPCASSETDKLSTYVLYENKAIIQLILEVKPVDPIFDLLFAGFLSEDQNMIVETFSVADYKSFSSNNKITPGISKVVVGIIPDGEYTRQVFYTPPENYFDVSPSTYMNVDRLVSKILGYLRYQIPPNEPKFIHEEAWIDYPEAPELDTTNPFIARYKQVLEDTKSTSEGLHTNVTWRWRIPEERFASPQYEWVYFAGAHNVGKTTLLDAIPNKIKGRSIPDEQEHIFSGYHIEILYEDKVHMTYFIGEGLDAFNGLLAPVSGLVALFFNVDDISSFQHVLDPQLHPENFQVLFVGTKLSTSPESNRQVFLQHLNNTTARYIEVCIDKPESVTELLSKIVFCSSHRIDYHREITEKELDEAFEGIIEEDENEANDNY